MIRTPALVEIHYALWAVLAVPFGFAGLFFVFPGLIFVKGTILLAIAAFLIFYVSRLTRFERGMWLLGIATHLIVLLAAVYYVPRWPAWLAIPLALANLYSVGVLLVYRGLWSGSAERGAQPA